MLSSLERVEFFRNIERECFKRADQLALSDSAGRDRAYFIIHLSRKFRQALEYAITDGELSQKQVADLIGTDRKRGFLGGLFDV